MTERDDLQVVQRPQRPGLLPCSGFRVIGGIGEGQDAQCPLMQSAELQSLEDARQAGAVGPQDA